MQKCRKKYVNRVNLKIVLHIRDRCPPGRHTPLVWYKVHTAPHTHTHSTHGLCAIRNRLRAIWPKFRGTLPPHGVDTRAPSCCSSSSMRWCVPMSYNIVLNRAASALLRGTRAFGAVVAIRRDADDDGRPESLSFALNCLRLCVYVCSSNPLMLVLVLVLVVLGR